MTLALHRQLRLTFIPSHSFAAVAVYQKWHPDAAGSDTSGGTASNSALIGIMVYMVFSFYWTSREQLEMLLDATR
jgi:hypothetical protein